MATITGTNGNDTLVGGADPDTISPLLGGDIVDGGGGSDTLIVDYSSAPIDPFAGASPANFMSVVTSVGGSFAGYVRTIDAGNSVNFSNIEHLQVKLDAWHNTFIIDGAALAFGATLTLDGGAGTDTLDADLSTLAVATLNAGAGGVTASFGTFVNVEAFKLNLTAAADSVTGGSGNDTFNGNGGDDVLNGGGGNDVINGGSGSNSLSGGDGDDRIVSVGIDTVDGGAHNFDGDRWVGDYGSSTDNLTFTRDRAAGTGTLSNGTTLIGIERIEALTTGSGNDVVTFTGSSESFNVATGAGEDSLSFTGDAFSGTITADGAGAFKGLLANNLFSGVEHLGFVDSGGSELITVDAAPLLGGATLSLNGAGGNDTLVIDFSAFGAISFAVGASGTVTTNVAATLTSFEIFQITTGGGADFISTIAGDDIVNAGGGSDVISTGAGNDRLDGGAGADSMTGGAGNDTYFIDDAGDSVAENAAEGTDEIRTGFATFSLASLTNFENLFGTSAAGQTLTGNASNNAITGGSGNDVIDGGAGADTMRGEAGNDLYFVDDIGDVIIEFHEGDYDEVRTGLAVYSLDISASVEKLVGTSDLGQSLTGSYGSNLIIGGAGDDILDFGGAGTDTLAGGLGDDIYIVTYNTTVTELDGEGVDEVRTHGNYSIAAMANVENLTGLSTFWDQQLTGNALANIITSGGGWDTLDGGAGNDSLFGGAGFDTLKGGIGDDLLDGGADWDIMTGGTGNDIYFVDDADESVVENGAAGTDEIRTALASYSLASLANVENLTGLGSGNQSLVGNDSANVIDGGLGADSMAGGLGDDVYLVDDEGDSVIESAGEGIDEVRTALASYAIGNNIENLFGLSGSGQTLTGNSLNNVISGGGSDDVIDGGLEADTMAGGVGNDVYTVDNIGDAVVEAGDSGNDEVRTALATYAIGSNIEKLTGTSNGGQTLTGNGLANTIAAGSGNDTLDGGLGADSLSGGLGNDIYVVDNGLDVVTEAAGSGNDEIRTALAAYSLAANVETLTGLSDAGQVLTGNDLANVITGRFGNDVIDGGLGADTMSGWVGNDVYLVDNGGDAVVEGDYFGIDEVRTNLASFSIAGFAYVENLTGGSGDQTLTGNGFNNLIDGGAGADAMAGGGGHDVYIVDNAGDTVTELDGQGTDEVRTSVGSKTAPDYALYVLPSFVENLTGTAAGDQGVSDNALDNVVTMGGGHDLIVMSSGGVDTVNAGGGNDFIYYGDTLTGADVTNGGGGVDTIGLIGDYASGIAFTAANLIGVERLALYTSLYLPGTGPNTYNITMSDANVAAGAELFVTAASLQSNESLIFNGSAETNGKFTIHGGAGNDSLTGGSGNDFFLGRNGDDTLNGGGGNDFLYGGLGTDQLTGGAGFDSFRYQSAAQSSAASMDHILDFTDLDRIDLSEIDADGNGGNGNQAFSFIGSNAFGNVAGQLRAYQSGADWFVEGDTNGDGVADLVIQVTITDPTLLGLGASDFNL